MNCVSWLLYRNDNNFGKIIPLVEKLLFATNCLQLKLSLATKTCHLRLWFGTITITNNSFSCEWLIANESFSTSVCNIILLNYSFWRIMFSKCRWMGSSILLFKYIRGCEWSFKLTFSLSWFHVVTFVLNLEISLLCNEPMLQ